MNAMLDDNIKRGIAVVPRRNGKDLTMWNGLIANAFKRVGLYYYLAPYYNQIRQIIWEGYDKSGRRFLDYIPQELVKSRTKIDMRIDLVNGSQIKLQGSDQIDRIVGTNPIFVVFTEYSLHKPGAWDYLRPVLAENDGQAWFNGTPRGFNHFYDRYQDALGNPNWYTTYLTRDDTGIPSLEAIEEDRRSGMPAELIKQEYYCSFLSGSVGSYYGSYIEAARENGRITRVPWEPKLPVYTVWDLGISDKNAIWFFQLYRNEVRLIDYYENEGEAMHHYIQECRDKPYAYGEHMAPHDIEVREYTSGRTRREIAETDHNFVFTVVPRQDLEDGIEAVRSILPQCYFDAHNTAEGVKALSHYKKSKNDKTGAFSLKPVHDWSSNGADAFRYLAQCLDMLRRGQQTGHKKPRVNRAVGGRASLYRKPNVRRAVAA